MSHLSVNIIGGGFSGLVQAFYLVEKGVQVHLYEKSDRLGGLLNTKVNNGFLIESAANAFLANQEIEWISQKIQVPLVPTLQSARKRFIYHNGQMSRWPLSFKGSLQTVPFLMSRLFKRPLHIKKDETLKSWGLRELGLEATENLLEPAMQGIFTVASDQLDAELVLNSLFKPRVKGQLRGSIAPEKGMGFFVEQMVSYLKEKGCVFHLNSSEVPKGHNIYALSIAHLKALYANNLLSLPSSIEKTSAVSLSSAVLMFEDKASVREGFGCLFPHKKGFHSLGVLFNQNIFANRVQRGSSETWILNDSKTRVSEMNQGEVIDLVQSDRNRLFDSSQKPFQYSIHQWKCRIPLYDRFLREFVNDLDQFTQDSLFCGHALGELGLSKLIFRAKENAQKVEGGYFG